MDKVTVTQADREAAAEIERIACGPKSEIKAILSGERDSDPLVQAFARHRIVATRQAEEQIKLLRGALEPVASVEFLSPEENYADNDLVMVSVGTVRAARQALEATSPQPGKRCPTCGDPVITTFDHLGTDCEAANG